MKLLIISDLHSNIANLDAVLAAEADSDMIYCAGDLVDVGFDPCALIDRVREREIICVRGNHDDAVVKLWHEGVDPQATPANFRELNAQQLDAPRIAFLESLPLRVTFAHDGVSYLMEHLYKGYELLNSDYIFDQFWGESPVQPGSRHRCMIFGHTHHQGHLWLAPDRCWINPGSIGYNRPSDPFPGTRYMTIVDGEVHFHRLQHPAWRSRPELKQAFLSAYPQPSS